MADWTAAYRPESRPGMRLQEWTADNPMHRAAFGAARGGMGPAARMAAAAVLAAMPVLSFASCVFAPQDVAAAPSRPAAASVKDSGSAPGGWMPPQGLSAYCMNAECALDQGDRFPMRMWGDEAARRGSRHWKSMNAGDRVRLAQTVDDVLEHIAPDGMLLGRRVGSAQMRNLKLLLMEIMAQETDCGRHDLNAAHACGLGQLEYGNSSCKGQYTPTNQFKDVPAWMAKNDPGLAKRVMSLFDPRAAGEKASGRDVFRLNRIANVPWTVGLLLGHLLENTRGKLLSMNIGSVDARSQVWKKWINTSAGRGTPEEYVRHAEEFRIGAAVQEQEQLHRQGSPSVRGDSGKDAVHSRKDSPTGAKAERKAAGMDDGLQLEPLPLLDMVMQGTAPDGGGDAARQSEDFVRHLGAIASKMASAQAKPQASEASGQAEDVFFGSLADAAKRSSSQGMQELRWEAPRR